jgi:dihydroorotate dehydrogenase (fumarate)
MDLTTKYMGLSLSNPVVAGASPLSKELDKVKALAEAGAGAIVMHSIFEEQLAQEALALNYYIEQGAESFAESLSHFPPMEAYKVGPELYLENIAAARKAADVPIIASLNGVSLGGWIDYAAKIQQAGADALELNVYLIPTNRKVSGAKIEKAYLDIVKAVRAAVTIPLAVKLSPFFSAPVNMARRLKAAGADALVLFNRFYQPDIDVEKLEVAPRLVLSDSDESRLPMRWIAILFGRVRLSLAATSGVHTGEDAAKLILAGADAVQVVSALLQDGIGQLTKIRDDMAELLAGKGYRSIRKARGVMSQRKCPEPAVFERANYIETLQSYPQRPGTI